MESWFNKVCFAFSDGVATSPSPFLCGPLCSVCSCWQHLLDRASFLLTTMKQSHECELFVKRILLLDQLTIFARFVKNDGCVLGGNDRPWGLQEMALLKFQIRSRYGGRCQGFNERPVLLHRESFETLEWMDFWSSGGTAVVCCFLLPAKVPVSVHYLLCA